MTSTTTKEQMLNNSQANGARLYSVEQNRFDMNTYVGRCRYYFGLFNPRNSFVSTSEILAQKKLVDDQRALEKKAREEGTQVYLSEDKINELEHAKVIVGSSIHPDTQQPIPWAMRMCSFVPTNLPIIFGMLMTAPTPVNTAFWQWFNQTYNAALNYGNRNASSEQTTFDIASGYAVAVSGAVGVGVGLRKLLAGSTKNLKGGALVFANSMISYSAVSCANFLNTFFMRLGEMKRGIKIYDDLGEEMGTSKVCAKQAVISTATSRVVMSMPTFFIPGISMVVLDKLGLIPKGKVGKTILDLGVIAIALSLACPLSVSMFPARGEIEASKLEPQFLEMKNSRGAIVEKFYYNKGL